jgi:hypothetical protein
VVGRSEAPLPTKDLFTRVIHVKEESLLGGRSEAPLPPNKRFFLIVYKMLVLGLGRKRKLRFLPSCRPSTNIFITITR